MASQRMFIIAIHSVGALHAAPVLIGANVFAPYNISAGNDAAA